MLGRSCIIGEMLGCHAAGRRGWRKLRVPASVLGTILTAAIMLANTDRLGAQWLNYPTPGTPLTKAGAPDLAAKTPRASNGKPDLSGVWQIERPQPGDYERFYGPAGAGQVFGDDVRDQNKYFFNLFVDFKPGEEPLRFEAREQTRRNQQNVIANSPSSHCLPYGLPARYFNARPFKIFQTPEAIVMYFELDGAFRQIHTDGRKLPVDPFPSWIGYSVGTWEGDALVADTAGFNDKSWLDARGHGHSEALRVEERFHRRDFGHMDIEATVDDPVTLTKAVTVKFTVHLIPNSDVLETFCAEGERDQVYAQQPAK